MKEEKYISIRERLGELIRGSEWEGHVYCVGGCCRDEIMGQEIKDIDLVINLPEGGIRLAEWMKAKGYTAGGVVTYPTYGTAMFQLKDFPDVELECVQTRKEKYPDPSSRNPVTVYGSIQEDCMRRDLTINAIYCNVSTGEMLDICGHSFDDIRDQIIRTPVDPDITYDDDPLRILRCIRFASRYGWKIEQGTYEGMVRNVNRLAIITKERIQTELDKMLTCAYPVQAMETLRLSGAMHYVIPELEETFSMTQNQYHCGTVWEHSMMVLSNMQSQKLSLRMAALLHDIGKTKTRTEEEGKVHFLEHEKASSKMIPSILKRLKYSNAFIKEVQLLCAKHMCLKSYGDDCERLKDKKLRALQYECGSEEVFEDLLELIHADNMAHTEEYQMPNQVSIIHKRTEAMKAEGSAMFSFEIPLDGTEIAEQKGLTPGPAIKQCKEYLLKLAYVEPRRSKDEWIKLVKGYKA